MKKIKPDEIELKFILDDQETEIICCKLNETFENMFDVYCKIKKIVKNSVYILYNGETIKNYDITIDKLANNLSKSNKEITLLVRHKPKSVLIVFSHSGNLYKEKKDIDAKLYIIFSDYLSKNNININNVVLKYNTQIVDLKLTINQFITEYNINFGNIDAENDDNLIEINMDVIDINIDINEKDKLISFSYKNNKHKKSYAPEKNMGEIFNLYANEIGVNRNRLEFKYNGITINENQTLNKFINDNNIVDNQNNTIDQIKVNEFKDNKTQENEPIINIDVIDISWLSYCFSTYKLPVFIVIGVIIVAVAIILIILLVNKDSNNSNNNSSSPITNNDIVIPNDYFINATYLSNESELVKLISDEYDLNKIKNMSIDGKIIKPLKFYIFIEKGQHIIYYSFNQLSDKSLLSEGRGIFSGITKLTHIKFSNSFGSNPDVSFQGMFNNCINLLSVDFSMVEQNDNFYNKYYETDIYDYYYSMDYMFNNCKKLISINFDYKKEEGSSNLYIISSKYMFNNCESLTELHISRIDFYKNLNNMFSNCVSLNSVFLNDFNYYDKDLNMSYMFYNCTSLATLIFPSESLNIPYDMSYSFAYCYSLKKLELEFDNNYYYDFVYKNMSNAFRNCSSLVSVTLKFDFYYEDMSYLFKGCSSLETINTDYYNGFFIPYTKYINGMFIDCLSLFEKILFDGYNLIDISYMFSGSSISEVDFAFLDTTNITNYEGLFYNCEYLYSVDLSSFTHNDLPDSNLSIFKGDYFIETTLIVNEEFLSRIKVPSNFVIIIYNESDYI